MADKNLMPPKVHPNFQRQIVLVLLAVAGIGIGYGLGFVFKKDVPPPVPLASEASETTTPQERLSPILPESNGQGNTGIIRAYEEALPDNIVEADIPPLTPIKSTIPPVPLPTDKDQTRVKSALELVKTENREVSEPEHQQQALAPTVGQESKDDTFQSSNPPAPISTWQINALPFKINNRPKIAIVIDDMGVDRKRSERAVALRPPLTLSYLTYGKDLGTQTISAKNAGHELLMHIPMEPTSTTVDPGPNVLLSDMDETELLKNLRWNLNQFDGYVGINNHMGSRFTSNLAGMQNVMEELKTRGLLFLDSVTSGASKGSQAAKAAGIPHLVRNVFLDHIDDLATINKRLSETEQLALKQGHAIAIGHPRDQTLAALTPWLKTIEDKGFQLVPLTALLVLAPNKPEGKPETAN